jgi:hypothetical protein
MSIRRTTAGLAALLVSTAALAACSSTDSEPTPSASPTESATESASASATTSASAGQSPTASGSDNAATVEFNKKVQQELNAVGCQAGPVDGVPGKQTDAAILRFQQAAGLTVDGELGPQTDAALDKAAAAGETVCTGQPTATPSPTVTHSSGAACTAESLSAAVKQGETIVRYTCADFLDDRIAAGKVTEQGPEYSFYARVEGDGWVAMDANLICGDVGSALPAKIYKYCSDGE